MDFRFWIDGKAIWHKQKSGETAPLADSLNWHHRAATAAAGLAAGVRS